MLLLIAYLIYRLLGPGLGGFVENDGVTEAQPVLFIQEAPFNNMWLMVVLIWVQTGFAMVILSAAIKAVPTELIEAAKVDGANESQVFWRITLPQIAPTIGVVITALFVTVMKVFDIVYAMTNGSFGTQVIANEMFERAFGFSDLGLGSALGDRAVHRCDPGDVHQHPPDAAGADMTAGVVDPGRPSAGAGGAVYRFLRSIPTWVLWLLVIIWSIPTIGLLVNSVRDRDQQRSRGWWTVFTGNLDGLTLDNYREVLGTTAAGGMKQGLTNSLAIALPATIIPIAFAAFAAYAFAWIDFKHRQGLFIATVALLAVPLQVALIPLLLMYVNGGHWTIPWLDKTVTIFPDLNLAGTTTAVWLTHTAFAMPFAIFLLHNYMSSLPKDIFESARIDGANHFKIFYKLVLPLSVPVLAAFAIFQFLWTWNDYLIAVTMIGANQSAAPSTVVIAAQTGQFGQFEHLLTAGAFLQAAVPLAVFFLLQRFFVRGILAGSVKG